MKVALVLNDDFSAWHFRKGLIAALITRGIEVIVVTPDGAYVPRLVGLGAQHVVVPMHRFVSPLRDLKLCLDLYRVFRSKRPDLVHNMTVKPNIYGALAARLAGVPKVVALVSGLGYAFSEDGGLKQWMLRRFVRRLYWVAGKLSSRVWIQNRDDLSLLVESGIIDRDKAVLIRSSGVNLHEYSPENTDQSEVEKLRAELAIDASTRVVLMSVARVVWSKGVKEFVEASECASRWCSRVLFVLIGPLDPASPDAVPETYLRQKTSPHFIWLGFRQEVKEMLSLADIVTLPSYYREGVPRALLEAMAMGKPIVTTNNVGCREVVDEGKNGFLVPVRDSSALASAIEILIHDNERRIVFGYHSRAKAQAEFNEDTVIKRILTELYGLSI